MNEARKFLEKYQSMNTHDIVSHSGLSSDLEPLLKNMDASDADTQSEIRGILKSLLSEIDQQIGNILGEMGANKDAIESAEKNAEACIAYLTASQQNKARR